MQIRPNRERCPTASPLLFLFLAALSAFCLWITGSTVAAAADTTPLCRFGVGASAGIAGYPIGNMRFSWYADWFATVDAPRPNDMTYIPTVRFELTGPGQYTALVTPEELAAIAAAHPGSTWVVGNEPDRRYYQDGLEPAIYARAYHEYYTKIKALDPTARIAAGNIVQPTPLRLQYLDMVLNSYYAQFGEPMPVDVWNIHAFILREVSCNYDPNACWGADVPPGIDAPYGMLYEIQDNDNIQVFKQFIVDFRQWMQSRGYQDRPLIITEFGILMPADYGFTTERVNAYMNQAFDYLSTASGPTGYLPDNNRYVQQWAWYSLDDAKFNGTLFDTVTRLPTAFGDNFARYTGQVASQVNLQALSWSVSAPAKAGGGYNQRLEVRIANNGNVRSGGTVRVRFYDGDPASGATPIVPDSTLAGLEGCARDVATVSVDLTVQGAAPVEIWVVVDPDDTVAETNEADNTLHFRLAPPNFRILLPRVDSSRY